MTGSAATGTPGTIESLETELGPARMFSAVPADNRLVLLLGHGAGREAALAAMACGARGRSDVLA